MRRLAMLSFLLVFFFCLLSNESEGCTTFYLGEGEHPVFGKNYDWMVEDGLVIINKRGVKKIALQQPNQTGEPFSWTSKYGSVSFNQYGREVVMGGMNQAGLIVETMQLDATKYPAPGSRPALLSSQWKQYVLDRFKSVEQVIADSRRVTIRPSAGPGVHYLLSDKSGDSAVIEYLDGEFVCHTRNNMPVKALTNSIYELSVQAFREYPSPPFSADTSLGRFITAAKMLESYDADTVTSNIDFGFDILKNTHQGRTRWSIVYDINNSRIYFKTAQNPKIRYLDLKGFDFSCKTPVKVLDMAADLKGDVTNAFTNYTFEINRNLIQNAFSKTPSLSRVPKERLDRLSKYPDTTVCTQ